MEKATGIRDTELIPYEKMDSQGKKEPGTTWLKTVRNLDSLSQEATG